MLAELVNTNGNYEQLQRDAATVPRGQKGLAYGNPAHVLNAAILIKQQWEELPAKSIEACWRRAKCLPPSIENEQFSNQVMQKICGSEHLKLRNFYQQFASADATRPADLAAECVAQIERSLNGDLTAKLYFKTRS